MDKGKSRVTEYVLRNIEKIEDIDLYVNEVVNRSFLSFSSKEDVLNCFGYEMDTFFNSITEEERLSLISYTGYNFKNINAILRGNWNYEVNGKLTEDIKERFYNDAKNIKRIMQKFPSLGADFITYRGVGLDSFRDYGITSLEELKELQGNYMYERGFTSTSIIKDNSFFDKDLDFGEKRNIEISYLIPTESDDGTLLLDPNLSYAHLQNEYLIQSGSLSKVIGVEINNDLETAKIKAVLIPTKVWNLRDYEMSREGTMTKNI